MCRRSREGCARRGFRLGERSLWLWSVQREVLALLGIVCSSNDGLKDQAGMFFVLLTTVESFGGKQK